MNVFARSMTLFVVAAVVVVGLAPSLSLSQVNRDLHKAAEAGDLTAMKERIDKGDSVNGRDKNGFTPLMLAAMEGKVEAIHLLLRNGADVNARTDLGDLSSFTALIGAVGSRQAEAAKVLISKGADINDRLGGRYSPLVIASATGLTEVVDLLLQKGADRTNLEKYAAEWKKIEWAKMHTFPAERAQLDAALRNAHNAALMYLLENKGIITAESQLVQFGWKNYYEGVVFVRADMTETAGGIVLRNKYLDETNSTAVSNLKPGEGMIDFNGERKLPSPK